MKIRIMGTQEECLKMSCLFLKQRNNNSVSNVEVSRLYPNQLTSECFRVYVDINIKNPSWFTELSAPKKIGGVR